MTSRTFTTPYPLINVMSQAAFKAGRGLIRDFGEVEHLQISRKGPGDFVSKADQRAEKTIYLELSKARPEYAFLMEESGEIEGDYSDSPTWIVDPLDGTTNFLHGIPHFAVSIALRKQDEIIAGVIYDPLQDELYWAEKGSGAFMNDRRLRVSSRKTLADAVIGTGLPFIGHPVEKDVQLLQGVLPHVAGVRQLGSAALDLAYVASGRFEGYWESNLAPWDLAAGLILIKEAGGWISDFSGKKEMKSVLEKGDVLACNTTLFQPLQNLLKS
ncbi:MAG: inositol monophosphatase family protein [Alphaproteobacteria bacterium]